MFMCNCMISRIENSATVLWAIFVGDWVWLMFISPQANRWILSLCCLCTHCRISEDCVEVSEQFYSNPSQWLSTHYPTTDSAPSHIVLFEGMMKVIVKVHIKVTCWCEQCHRHNHVMLHYYTGRKTAVS